MYNNPKSIGEFNMYLSLGSDTDSGAYLIHLSAPSGEKSGDISSFGSSLDYFLNIVERLKQLPKGDPMQDFVSVRVDLAERVVTFSPTTVYIDPRMSREALESQMSVSMTLDEFMMIPLVEIATLTSPETARLCKDKNFPEGEDITVGEAVERYPWLATNRVSLGGHVTVFQLEVDGVEPLRVEINKGFARYGLFQYLIFDEAGKELGDMARDGSTPSEYAQEQFGWDWDKILGNARYLVLNDYAGTQHSVLFEVHRSVLAES